MFMWIIYHQLRPSQVKLTILVVHRKLALAMNFQNQQLEDATFLPPNFQIRCVCFLCVWGEPKQFFVARVQGKNSKHGPTGD